MLLNHYPPCSNWLNKPSRQTERVRRGLIKQFGAENAVRIIDSINQGEHQVPINLQHSIGIRPGTTDLLTFFHMFGESPYELCFPGLGPRLIIDCGANVGYASFLFARKYPGADILAIEPDDNNFLALCGNLRRFPNVKCVKAAIWGSEKDLHIVNSEAGARSFRVEEIGKTKSSALKGITIDHILKEVRGDVIDILKVDIEGAERELFKHGTPHWLERTKVLLIELHDFIVPGCSAVFYGAIKDLPFIMFYDGETIIAVNTQLIHGGEFGNIS